MMLKLFLILHFINTYLSILHCNCILYSRIREVTANILKAIENLLKFDIKKYVRDGQVSDSEEDSSDPNLVMINVPTNVSLLSKDETVQNTDLAEADQSRIEIEIDDDEEGAVGGIFNIFMERSPNQSQVAVYKNV